MGAIENDWKEKLAYEFEQPYYRELYRFLIKEYHERVIYPPSEDIFNAFHLTPVHKVKAVILGQDPYHEPGQAEGLCFSVKPGVAIPPSLENIYKELHDDIGFRIPNNGSLVKWAKEGVLLLNSLLTVRAHAAFSHKGKGWEEFTDAAVRVLNKEDRPIVFLLWGKSAQDKGAVLNNPKHLILKAPHPSPLSAYRGFFGCKHFSRANEFLKANGETPIDW
jgi:uracil-DNA glycosylase